MSAVPLRPPVPWLAFAEFRVLRSDTLDRCLADFPAGPAAVWPLLVLQVTFDLVRLTDPARPPFRRTQYARAWPVGTCAADAVGRIASRGLLVPLAVRWDGTPAVAFELSERLSPAREATRLKKVRVRPLRTYLVFVGDERFAPTGDGKRWLKLAAEGNAVRRVELRKTGPKPASDVSAEPVPGQTAA